MFLFKTAMERARYQALPLLVLKLNGFLFLYKQRVIIFRIHQMQQRI